MNVSCIDALILLQMRHLLPPGDWMPIPTMGARVAHHFLQPVGVPTEEAYEGR